jgi:hypothetical protein
MSHSVPLWLTIVVAGASVGMIEPAALRAEPLSLQRSASGDIVKAGVRSPFLLPAGVVANESIKVETSAGKLASAVRPLDLRKLTLSDFGDTDRSR